MTKKEEQPKRGEDDQFQENSEKLSYDPEITDHDKDVLNNQSQDEGKGDYAEERKKPVDFEGENLDIPKTDTEEKKFNETASKPDDSTKNKRPKDSANSNDNIETESETVYKGTKAEDYKDPSKKNDSSKK